MPSRATVHLVEDDGEVRRSLEWLLAGAGLHVEAYESGEQFLEISKSDQPGCVLIDLRPPGMNGFDLIQEMAERRWSIPAIVLTGFGAVPPTLRTPQADVVEFVEKPFNPEKLLNRVRQALADDAETRRSRRTRAADRGGGDQPVD